MADVHTPSVRSKNMRAIRHRDTQPEMLVRKALHAKGFRFRVNVKALPGTPDIVLPKYRALLFIHGCFWHGHRCPMFKIPKTRTDFWLAKIETNRQRDIIARENLFAAGWRIAIIWECALRGRQKHSMNALVGQLSAWLADPRIQSIELQGTGIEEIANRPVQSVGLPKLKEISKEI